MMKLLDLFQNLGFFFAVSWCASMEYPTSTVSQFTLDTNGDFGDLTLNLGQNCHCH